MRLGSGAFEGEYSFTSRMENGPGTNPEELIGAAEAGCFSMAFANDLSEAGHTHRTSAPRPPCNSVRPGEGSASPRSS